MFPISTTVISPQQLDVDNIQKNPNLRYWYTRYSEILSKAFQSFPFKKWDAKEHHKLSFNVSLPQQCNTEENIYSILQMLRENKPVAIHRLQKQQDLIEDQQLRVLQAWLELGEC